jgi:arylsulfatase A-like enzyme
MGVTAGIETLCAAHLRAINGEDAQPSWAVGGGNPGLLPCGARLVFPMLRKLAWPASALLGASLPFLAELLAWSRLDPLGRPAGLEIDLEVLLVVAAAVGGLPGSRRNPAVAGIRAFGWALWIVLGNTVYGPLAHTLSLPGPRGKVAMVALAVAIATLVVALLWLPLRRFAYRPAVAVAAVGLLILLASGVLLSDGSLSSSTATVPTRKGPPDMVLIVLDTVRADHLSLYGYVRPTTPALDQLAKSSLVYDRAWSPAPWTPPSHASMLTGLLPAQHQCDGGPVDAHLPTVQKLLRHAGYHTLAVVNNPELGTGVGLRPGFELYREVWALPPRLPARLIRVGQRFLGKGWAWTGDAEGSLRSVRIWWADEASGPRFVLLNLIDAHSPYGWPGHDENRFLDESTRSAPDISNDSEDYDGGLVRAEGPALARVVARYDADIAYMDRYLGEFFAWLSRRGELDQTVIIVTSDHGERLGERGLLGHQLGLDAALLRVPLLVRYPPRVAAGRQQEIVETQGIGATVLEFAGMSAPPGWAPALDRQRLLVAVAQMRHQGWYVDLVKSRASHFDAAPFEGDWATATDGTWKLLRSTAGWQRLYHLPTDPTEIVDVAAEHPDVVARLSPELDALPKWGAAPTPIEMPQDTQDALRSLGYIK